MKAIFLIIIATLLISFQSYNNQEDILKKEIDRKELVTFAKSIMGTPYVYGTQDPKIGFDCSGFVNYVYKNFDIIVPRSSSGFKDFGKKIKVEDVAIGDVLVFTGYRDTTSIGHLGIVCEADGMHSKFIHASSGKVMQVTISDLNSAHYSKRFHHAVDVINQ
ncbi:MAG: C40 family peptidase [Flavobacterium sp.]|nr:C40 family peptidase [Flavobacterium sp.]